MVFSEVLGKQYCWMEQEIHEECDFQRGAGKWRRRKKQTRKQQQQQN